MTSRPTSQRRCSVSIELSQALNRTGLVSEGVSSGRVRAGSIHSVATATSTSSTGWPTADAGLAGLGSRAARTDSPASAGEEQTHASTASATLAAARVSRKWMTPDPVRYTRSSLDHPAHRRRMSHSLQLRALSTPRLAHGDRQVAAFRSHDPRPPCQDPGRQVPDRNTLNLSVPRPASPDAASAAVPCPLRRRVDGAAYVSPSRATWPLVARHRPSGFLGTPWRSDHTKSTSPHATT